MRTLILLSGVTGAGKTTFVKNKFDAATIIKIASNEIRYEYTKDYSVMLPDMNVVYDEMIRRTNEAFKYNPDAVVLLDSTFLNDERREYFLSRIERDKTILYMLNFHNKEALYERNRHRAPQLIVPDDVITDMLSKFAPPSEENKNHYDEIHMIYMD